MSLGAMDATWRFTGRRTDRHLCETLLWATWLSGERMLSANKTTEGVHARGRSGQTSLAFTSNPLLAVQTH